MKTKPAFLLLHALFILLLGSCQTAKYLPDSTEIGFGLYGGQVELRKTDKQFLTGELIALDSTSLLIRQDANKGCVQVPIAEVNNFTLRYARPKKYWWSVPVYTLVTLSHGFFLVYSAPANAIATSTVAITGENAYQYSQKQLTYDQLRMFARFPQGMPPGVKPEELK
ncbi:MAG: hypothetical protein J0L99_09815 [Chitinophagales bacterium]|nr:hypothetical protein [Chitinophagales bacterium]